MATGKKVFVRAGEFLGEFLVKQNINLTENQKFLNTLNDLNGTTKVDSISTFQDSKFFTRQQFVEFFKTELIKEFSYIKVTDSQKEYSLQDMVQLIYNSTKWLEIINQSQFEATLDALTTNLAEIYKTIGLNNRKTVMKAMELTNAISDMANYTLDHFVGDKTSKETIYFRTTGNQLKVNDGGGTGSKFYEVLQVNSKTKTGANQAYIGDTIVIGGSETDSPITKILLNKEIIAKENIIMADGKELVGTALKARYADLAELYTSDKNYRPGTLLGINFNPEYEVTLFDPNSLESSYAGVVSDKPGFILNAELVLENPNLTTVPIVLNGKSPVRVVGNCIKGDVLFNHPSIPGTAIAVNPLLVNEYINSNIFTNKVGIALESSIEPNIGNIPIEHLIMVKI